MKFKVGDKIIDTNWYRDDENDLLEAGYWVIDSIDMTNYEYFCEGFNKDGTSTWNRHFTEQQLSGDTRISIGHYTNPDEDYDESDYREDDI